MTRPVPHEVMTNPSPTTPDRHTGGRDGSATTAGRAPARDLIVKAQCQCLASTIGSAGLGRPRGPGPRRPSHRAGLGRARRCPRYRQPASGSPKTPPPGPSRSWARPVWSSCSASQHQTASGVPATGSNSPTGLNCEPAQTIQTPPYPTPTTPVPIGKTAAVPPARTAATTVQTAKTRTPPRATTATAVLLDRTAQHRPKRCPLAHPTGAGRGPTRRPRRLHNTAGPQPPSSRRYSIWPPATTSLHFAPLPERTRTPGRVADRPPRPRKVRTPSRHE